jgi:3-hydroxybutyryl-CoA dehydrogenase
MVDIAAESVARGRATVESNMERQLRKGAITAEQKQKAGERITTATSIDAVSGASIVIEAATENRDLKFKLFADLDKVADPGAILASNTSSISITELAACTSRPDKVIGMHFMNPVPVMKLVEIIRGLATSDETASRIAELSRTLGKVPVEAHDYPGFVSNRVLMPMINEAVFCLMEGVADAGSIDQVMTLGMNHPMGPLALADLIGLDTCLAIMEVLHSGLGDPKYRPCPLLRKYVAAGWLGRKSGRGFHNYGGSDGISAVAAVQKAAAAKAGA